MRKWMIVTLAALLVSGSVVSGLALAYSNSKGATNNLEFFFDGSEDKQFSTSDRPENPAPGDMFGSTRDVYALAKSGIEPTGEKLGTSWVLCTALEPATGWLCEGAVHLDGRGQIMFAGPIDFTADFTDPAWASASVTGGTLEFAGARGVAIPVPLDEVEQDFAYTFDLIKHDKTWKNGKKAWNR